VEQALGQIGAQPQRHPEVLHNLRTSTQVHLGGSDEGNHIISVHRRAMPKATSRELSEQAHGRRPLKHKVKDIHHRIEEQRGERITLA
jgi:hypothetical protein